MRDAQHAMLCTESGIVRLGLTASAVFGPPEENNIADSGFVVDMEIGNLQFVN